MRAVAGAALVFAVACGHGENHYLDRQVRQSELVGTWRMTAQSVRDLQDIGYSAPLDPNDQVVTFASNGSCRFSTLPPVPVKAGRPVPKADAPCTWAIGRLDHPAVVIEVQGQRPFEARYYLKDERGRLMMWQYIADPDSLRLVEYLKAV